MTGVLYLELNLFALAVLLTLTVNLHRTVTMTLDEKLFRALMTAVMGTIVFDSAGWLLNGAGFSGAYAVLVTADTLYYIAVGCVCFIWMIYADHKLFGDAAGVKRRGRYYFIPFLAIQSMVLLTPANGWVFVIDQANFYHRGELFWVHTALVMAMLTAGCLPAVKRLPGERLPARRDEYLLILLFALPPALGTVIQLSFYGVSVIWPCTTLSLLIMFVNMQNRQISLDGLTGINNRRTFNRYMESRWAELGRGETITLMLMDVDDFKSINDRYGHERGDAALIRVAQALKLVCGRADVFLARYGGDEFAVSFCGERPGMSERVADEIRDELELVNASGEMPCRLSISIGSACLSGGDPGGVDTLISAADREMYREKRLREPQ